jgi:hypothetical protein
MWANWKGVGCQQYADNKCIAHQYHNRAHISEKDQGILDGRNRVYGCPRPQSQHPMLFGGEHAMQVLQSHLQHSGKAFKNHVLREEGIQEACLDGRVASGRDRA